MKVKSTIIRIVVDQSDGTTIQAGRVTASVDGETYYANSALADRDDYRTDLTFALFKWIGYVNDWADQQEETE